MILSTKKTLLETIGEIARCSKSRPVGKFMIDFIDENELIMYDKTIELYTLDDLVATMMDKSFLYRVVQVYVSGLAMGGICVVINLMPDGGYQTNIDAEFMEKLSELTIIPIEKKGQ